MQVYGLEYNALEFQIEDLNHHEWIAAGNIRAYQSGTFDMAGLALPVQDMPDQPGCQMG